MAKKEKDVVHTYPKAPCRDSIVIGRGLYQAFLRHVERNKGTKDHKKTLPLSIKTYHMCHVLSWQYKCSLMMGQQRDGLERCRATQNNERKQEKRGEVHNDRHAHLMNFELCAF